MSGTVTGSDVDAVELHPVEVDLLCTFAEVDAPFPLDIPSTGTTDLEQRLMFQAAGEQLAARGLAGTRGPVGPAAAFVRMLSSCTGTVYLVLAAGERSLGAVVLVDGMRTLLVTQSPDEPGRIVRLVQLSVDDAVRELLAVVPAVDAGSVPSFTVPLEPIRELFELMRQQHRNQGGTPTPLSDSDMDDLLWQHGIDEQLARRMTNLRQVLGSGQAGATRRAGSAGWQRIGAEVRWIDTGRGRFALADTGRDGMAWASVNPFSRNDLRGSLRNLAVTAREA
jgi:hypothetical protein